MRLYRRLAGHFRTAIDPSLGVRARISHAPQGPASVGAFALGLAEFAASSTTITMHPSASGGASGWTASGSKILFGTTLGYPII